MLSPYIFINTEGYWDFLSSFELFHFVNPFNGKQMWWIDDVPGLQKAILKYHHLLPSIYEMLDSSDSEIRTLALHYIGIEYESSELVKCIIENLI